MDEIDGVSKDDKGGIKALCQLVQTSNVNILFYIYVYIYIYLYIDCV